MMAGHPQKTDSKEFELVSPDQLPGQQSELVHYENGADMEIRVWADRSSAPDPTTWKADSVLVYMISDLVAASHGGLAEELPNALAAHFSHPAQALVAARRIQTSMVEFRACSPGQGFGAAIVIYSSATNYPAGSNREFVQRALGQASPGQILLAEDVRIGLRNLPGVEFRAVSPLVSVPGDSGLTELVWTSPERDSGEEGQPPIGATRIVNSPLRSLEKLEADKGEILSRSGDFAVPEQGEYPEQDRGTTAPEARGLGTREFVVTSPGSGEELEAARQPILTRTRVVAGLAVLVAVAALVAVFLRQGSSKVSAPSQPPAAQTVGSGGDGVKQPPAEEGTTEPQPPPVVESKKQSPAKPAKVERNDDEKKSGKNEGPIEVDGFFPKDIPGLLRMAQSAVGSGDYDTAEHEYKIILKLQPNNPDAAQGLRKLRLIREDNR